MDIIERVDSVLDDFYRETGKQATYIYLGYEEKMLLLKTKDFYMYYTNESIEKKTLLGKEMFFINTKNHLGVGV